MNCHTRAVSAAESFRNANADLFEDLNALSRTLSHDRPARGTPNGEVLHSLNNALNLLNMAQDERDLAICINSLEGYVFRLEAVEGRVEAHFRPASRLEEMRKAILVHLRP